MRVKNRKTIAFFLIVTFGLSIPFIQSFIFQKTTSSQNKIVVEKDIFLPFLHTTTNNNILLFFGYVGCIDICTPILEKLSNILKQTTHTTLYFINLTTKIDKELPLLFAQAFDKKFLGIYLDSNQLRQIDRAFMLSYSPKMFDDLELNHSDYLYHLTKNSNGSYRLHSIYFTHPIDEQALLFDMKESRL